MSEMVIQFPSIMNNDTCYSAMWQIDMWPAMANSTENLIEAN